MHPKAGALGREKTLWLVGIFVGISLFFDGVMLWSLGSAADNKV